MATRRIREYLDGNHVRYVIISHSPAFTASQVAESTHIRGKSLAKTVVVAIDGHLALAVVPSTKDVDMARLQDQTGTQNVRLADEAEFASRFEGCSLGAAPPFGNLFGMDTYIDRTLIEATHIAFNAGTHTDVVVMDTDDYLHLAKPILADISAEPIETSCYVSQM